MSESCVVAGLTLSPHASTIVETAIVFGRLLGVPCLFVHAGEDDPIQRAALTDLVEARAEGHPFEVLMEDLPPEEFLLRTAEANGARLIVIGAQEREGMFERLSGSVARRVARKAESPVLLMPLQVARAPLFERVVVSLRFDEDVAPMLAFVTGMLRAAGVSGFTIVQESGFMNRLAARHVDERDREQFDDEQRSLLADAMAVFDLGDFEVTLVVLDDTAEGLASMEYARSHQADLLVFQAPSRSLTLWDRVLTHPVESALAVLPSAMMLFRAPAEDIQADPATESDEAGE